MDRITNEEPYATRTIKSVCGNTTVEFYRNGLGVYSDVFANHIWVMPNSDTWGEVYLDEDPDQTIQRISDPKFFDI